MGCGVIIFGILLVWFASAFPQITMVLVAAVILLAIWAATSNASDHHGGNAYVRPARYDVPTQKKGGRKRSYQRIPRFRKPRPRPTGKRASRTGLERWMYPAKRSRKRR